MYTFEKRITIHRNPQEVFAFVSNPANMAQWQSGIESASWTSEGSPGVGSTFTVVAKFMGRKVETVIEIIDWDPPNAYSYKFDVGPFPIAATSSFEPKGEATEVILRAQIVGKGIFKFLEGFIGKQTESMDAKNYKTLKLLLDMGQS